MNKSKSFSDNNRLFGSDNDETLNNKIKDITKIIPMSKVNKDDFKQFSEKNRKVEIL